MFHGAIQKITVERFYEPRCMYRYLGLGLFCTEHYVSMGVRLLF